MYQVPILVCIYAAFFLLLCLLTPTRRSRDLVVIGRNGLEELEAARMEEFAVFMELLRLSQALKGERGESFNRMSHYFKLEIYEMSGSVGEEEI